MLSQSFKSLCYLKDEVVFYVTFGIKFFGNWSEKESIDCWRTVLLMAFLMKLTLSDRQHQLESYLQMEKRKNVNHYQFSKSKFELK